MHPLCSAPSSHILAVLLEQPSEVIPLPEPELHRSATAATAMALGGAYDYTGALADLEELHMAAGSLAKETKARKNPPHSPLP